MFKPISCSVYIYANCNFDAIAQKETYHHSFAVSTEGVFQKPCKSGIAKRNLAAFAVITFSQSFNAISKTEQTLVNHRSFFESISGSSSAVCALAKKRKKKTMLKMAMLILVVRNSPFR